MYLRLLRETYCSMFRTLFHEVLGDEVWPAFCSFFVAGRDFLLTLLMLFTITVFVFILLFAAPITTIFSYLKERECCRY